MANPITNFRNWQKVKQFNKELSKFDKTFSDYESLNLELYNYYDPEYSDQFERVNDRWLSGRSKIFERGYFDLSPVEAAAAGFSREEMVMHGVAADAENGEHPWCKERGLSAKIAAKFAEPLQNFASKHPIWQGFADTVSKTANGGRLPLTAESTAMLKITCDKKYYGDMRNPSLSDAEKAEIVNNYEAATKNIAMLAQRDGVDLSKANKIMSAKVRRQAGIDTDMRIMYPDYRTNNRMLASEPAQPKTVEEHMADYARKMIAFDQNCKRPADYRRNHKRPEYAELKEIALNSAAADNPDATDEITHMFDRANIEIANARLAKTNQPLMTVPPVYAEKYPVSEVSDFEITADTDVFDDSFDAESLTQEAADSVAADDAKISSAAANEIENEPETAEELADEIASLDEEIALNEQRSGIARDYLIQTLSEIVAYNTDVSYETMTLQQMMDYDIPDANNLHKTSEELNAMTDDELAAYATEVYETGREDVIKELFDYKTDGNPRAFPDDGHDIYQEIKSLSDEELAEAHDAMLDEQNSVDTPEFNARLDEISGVLGSDPQEISALPDKIKIELVKNYGEYQDDPELKDELQQVLDEYSFEKQNGLAGGEIPEYKPNMDRRVAEETVEKFYNMFRNYADSKGWDYNDGHDRMKAEEAVLERLAASDSGDYYSALTAKNYYE